MLVREGSYDIVVCVIYPFITTMVITKLDNYTLFIPLIWFDEKERKTDKELIKEKETSKNYSCWRHIMRMGHHEKSVWKRSHAKKLSMRVWFRKKKCRGFDQLIFSEKQRKKALLKSKPFSATCQADASNLRFVHFDFFVRWLNCLFQRNLNFKSCVWSNKHGGGGCIMVW